jgi:ubiquinone/menaquinone biosynthesis C-methylase UbiE
MAAADVAMKYTGALADQYERRRTGSPKWQFEQRAVEEFVQEFSGTVLDVPLGTGRFLGAYARHGLCVHGVDTSADMLAIATRNGAVNVTIGNILALDIADGAVDAVVCTRMLNWFTAAEMATALAEVARVSRRWVVVSLATADVAHGRSTGTTVHSRIDYSESLARAGLFVSRERILTMPGAMQRVSLLAKVSP